jgi:hypothetical protein
VGRKRGLKKERKEGGRDEEGVRRRREGWRKSGEEERGLKK